MKKNTHWYKKSYVNSGLDRIFTLTLSIFLVLSANLVSHTFDISQFYLKTIEVIILTLLTIMILWRAGKIAKEVENGQKIIVSDNSLKHLLIVKKYAITCIIPLFISVWSNKDNIELFGILVSAVLIILFKNYLDLVVAFDRSGYFSGFDNIRLDADSGVTAVKENNHSIIGDVVTFELFNEGKYKGYDKFTADEFLYLKNMIKETWAKEKTENKKF